MRLRRLREAYPASKFDAILEEGRESAASARTGYRPKSTAWEEVAYGYPVGVTIADVK